MQWAKDAKRKKKEKGEGEVGKEGCTLLNINEPTWQKVV